MGKFSDVVCGRYPDEFKNEIYALCQSQRDVLFTESGDEMWGKWMRHQQGKKAGAFERGDTTFGDWIECGVLGKSAPSTYIHTSILRDRVLRSDIPVEFRLRALVIMLLPSPALCPFWCPEDVDLPYFRCGGSSSESSFPEEIERLDAFGQAAGSFAIDLICLIFQYLVFPEKDYRNGPWLESCTSGYRRALFCLLQCADEIHIDKAFKYIDLSEFIDFKELESYKYKETLERAYGEGLMSSLALKRIDTELQRLVRVRFESCNKQDDQSCDRVFIRYTILVGSQLKTTRLVGCDFINRSIVVPPDILAAQLRFFLSVGCGSLLDTCAIGLVATLSDQKYAPLRHQLVHAWWQWEVKRKKHPKERIAFEWVAENYRAILGQLSNEDGEINMYITNLLEDWEKRSSIITDNQEVASMHMVADQRTEEAILFDSKDS